MRHDDALEQVTCARSLAVERNTLCVLLVLQNVRINNIRPHQPVGEVSAAVQKVLSSVRQRCKTDTEKVFKSCQSMRSDGQHSEYNVIVFSLIGAIGV